MKKMPALLFAALVAFTACKKDHNHSKPATGNLQNESGACLPGTVHGTWYTGLPLDGDTNYVEVSIEVTGTGTYHIGTDLQNGVRFSDSGEFTSTGLQVVRLKPIGTFTSPAVTNFTTSFDNGICGFTISVQDSSRGNSIPLNTWRFTARGHIYSGPATANLYDIPQQEGGLFNIIGKTTRMNSTAPDSNINMNMGMPQYNIFTGTYTTATVGNYFSFFSNDMPIYQAYEQIPSSLVTFVITNYENNVTSKTVVGTFSGATDSMGVVVPITNGAFRVQF